MKKSLKKKVLFLCTHNASRSQMAEAFLNHLYGESYEAFSAGTHPTQVHPLAKVVMQESGIDLSSHSSKPIETFKGEEFDYVITLCDKAKEECPFFPGGKRVMHRNFKSPIAKEAHQEEAIEDFRRVRDEIRNWIEAHFKPSSPKNET